MRFGTIRGVGVGPARAGLSRPAGAAWTGQDGAEYTLCTSNHNHLARRSTPGALLPHPSPLPMHPDCTPWNDVEPPPERTRAHELDIIPRDDEPPPPLFAFLARFASGYFPVVFPLQYLILSHSSCFWLFWLFPGYARLPNLPCMPFGVGMT